jgi:antitoxin component of RelBE/YafQ-DinJ toxin-antitoxin module
MKNDIKNNTIHIRLDKSTHSKFKELVKKEEYKMSQIVRLLIKKYILKKT